ncbi:MAG TPA: diacylglycerol kinase family protein [Candidatus Saccharimonadales bacterium]|nr:diacylglycerol kinase family protein [Candidatus Saccharimonadales bacterium]
MNGAETGEQLAVLANLKSSFPEKVERHVEAIQSMDDFDVLMVDTGPPDKVDNVQVVAETLRDNPGVKRLLVYGGDGTWSIAANGLIGSGRQDVALAISPCGNADDASSSLYGKGELEKPQDIRNLIRYGVPVPLPAIRVEREGGERYAAAYFGVGLSGQAAVEMNREEYRKKKEGRNPVLNRIADARKVLPLLSGDEKNIYRYINQDGSERAVRELLISNVSLFAREFVVNVDSWGEEVVANEFGPEAFVRGVIARLAKERYRTELTAKLYGSDLTPSAFKTVLEGRPMVPGIKGEPFSRLTMEMKQDTPIQLDGEPDIAPKGSTLDISVVPSAIQVLKPRHLRAVEPSGYGGELSRVVNY